MLLELRIKDFILIRSVAVEFGPMLNVLTGETGAGKSMLLGAINLLLGAPASKDAVRIGAEKASVTAVFDDAGHLSPALEEIGVDSEELLTLQREIGKSKNVARINGRIVTNAQLKAIAEQLIQIHGQNEQLELFDRDYQLSMIDRFAGHGLLSRVAELYGEMRNARLRLAELESLGEDRAKRIDFLEYQIAEIDQARLQPGEDEALERELAFLEHQEKIASVLAYAQDWISGERDGNAAYVSAHIASELRRVFEYAEDLRELYEGFHDLSAQIAEYGRSVDRYIERMELGPERLREVEERLDRINHLKLKYGQSIEAISDSRSKMQEQLEELSALEERIEAERIRLDSLCVQYDSVASALTRARTEAARSFELRLSEQLRELNMKDAAVRFEISGLDARTERGVDHIDFTISTSPGQPLRSIKKVVSGGELSRIMLAIKIVQNDDKPMLFDEVDAGISGSTANVVGQKLMQLSRGGQLICITHLPQIAAYADTHLFIEKSSDEHQALTRVEVLDESGVESELARLVGGVEINELTLRHARDMLEGARRLKK